jgi:serine protease
MLSTSQNTVLPLEPNTNTITNNSFNAAPGALNSDLLSPVQTRLQAIASSDDFFTRVLGEKANSAEIRAIRSQWAAGDFSIFPKLQIVDAAVMGEAFGAYSQTNQTIYLSDALLANGVDDCMFGATGVLIEETFHWLDSLVGDDTPGDEGELARYLAFGVTPNEADLSRISQEQDQGLLWLNGQAVAVEFSGDLAGNNLASARNITLGSTPTTFRDWVGSTDTLDYYRFTLNQTSTVNLSLTNLSADANLSLLDANGRWLAGNWRSGTASESITRELNAGTYFIEVRQRSGSTHYTLTASATAVPDLAGNTFATARNITLSSTPTTFRDWVGSTDTLDYYRFTLNQVSTVNFSLTGLSADADLSLLDANGRLLARDRRSGTASESITRELNAGTYFIEVRQRSGSTHYNLTASATPILPVVTIQATDATAAETNPGQTPNPGRFTLTRTGSTTHALTVNYTISGTATNGRDYNNLTGTVTFAAGASTVDILVNPIDDTLKEGLETVVLTLASDPNYQIGTSNTATVNIIDNEDNIVSGTLRADAFTFTPGYLRTVFIGNGNVDYGAGRRDEIDLSTVSYGTVTFNLANTNGGGVVFDPGNGNHRIFDALTLNDGKEILFEGIERIRFADRTLDLSVTPNDPHFNQQWNLHMIGVHHAWRFTTGSSNVLIGIQDSGLGVDSQNKVHPEIRTTTILPSNYRDEFGKPSSHGTAVQGIIAAKSNNGSGIAGINWNSNVFHIDVLDNHDDNDLKLHEAAQDMINEANRLGQRLVINMSLSRSSFGENLHRDLEGVVSKNPNVLFVISSGNEGHLGRSGIASPAFLASMYDNVIAVGAVWGTKNWHSEPTTPGTRIEYTRDYPNFNEWGSQYGTGLTLMAPSEVRTTIARNATGSVTFGYGLFDGTSAAAPHVTGVASLIWSVNPNLTAEELKTIMSQTAYKGVPDYSEDYYGQGVVNADAAVRRAMAMARGSA